MGESDDIKITQCMSVVAELALALGVKSISKLPGCWEYQIDERWWIAANGHRESTVCSKGGPIIPAFYVYVEYNGFPAGLFNAFGGQLATGIGANERIFCTAIRKAIRKAGTNSRRQADE